MAAFVPPDGLPYVTRPMLNDMGTPRNAPRYAACLFLIPPDVKSNIDLAINLWASKRGALQSLWRTLRRSLLPDQRRESLALRDLSQQLEAFNRINVYEENIVGSIGYYWSERDRAYIQAMVVASDGNTVTVQPNIHILMKIHQENVASPDDKLFLGSTISPENLRPFHVVIKPADTYKL